MNNLLNMIITDIQPPLIVQSKNGRIFSMNDRKSYGLSLCISGQITYTMNNKKYVSHPGNAVLLPMGSTYSLLGEKDGLFPVVNFTCNNFHCDEILVLELEQAPVCIKCFENLKNLYERGGNKLEIYSVFYDLLSKVFGEHTQNPAPLDFAIKYIENNLQNIELKNTTLAEKIGISEVYLRKLFSRHYSVTPKQYILNTRICKAKQMLISTPFNVTTIALECGFSSVYHFCRAFKQQTGLTPTQYAEKNIIHKM